MTSVEGPQIFLLSLAYQSFLDEQYSSLIDSLAKLSQLKRAKSASGAIRYLEENNPAALLVTDEGLTEAQNGAVLEKVLLYLRGGGLVIIGLHFPSFILMDAFDNLFNDSFGLSWKRGDYHRTTFQLNPSCTLPARVGMDSFPAPYSMKALHVKNAQPHERIFVPAPDGMTQSLVFPPSQVDNSQAAVAGASVGDGFIAYVGDVNSEEGSEKIILALCGLGQTA